ncbi:MAG: response regulator [Pseudomonadota bacterium]
MKTPGISGLRILLVEDEPANTYLFREFLSRATGLAGAEIRDTNRLSTALDMLEAEHYDLVFLDLGLPDSCGLETLEAFRERAPTTPVVVLSGSMDPATRVRARALGAAAYLNKADSFPGALERAVREALLRIPDLS